jgi:hypothetical protein
MNLAVTQTPKPARKAWNFKWTKEAVIKEAKNYLMPYHFQLKAKGAYWSAQQNGWLKEACAHMGGIAIWNLKSAQAEAKKYKVRKDFRKNSRGAYQHLVRISKATLDEACSHMEKRFVWTPESALAEARKYSTRQELREKSDGCYTYLFRVKLAEKAFTHMKSVIIPIEKIEQAKFEKVLREFLVKNKIKFVLLKEFTVSPKGSHRVDMLINLISLNLKVAIEYKSDSRHWNKEKIEAQRKFYQKHLAKLKVKETFLVSKKGKYGWSEEKFMEELAKMLKSKKEVKYK